MKPSIIIKQTITLTIGGQTIELTKTEAESLRDALIEVVGSGDREPKSTPFNDLDAFQKLKKQIEEDRSLYPKDVPWPPIIPSNPFKPLQGLERPEPKLPQIWCDTTH